MQTDLRQFVRAPGIDERAADAAGLRTLVVYEREDETTMRFGDDPPMYPPDLESFKAPAVFGERMTMRVPLWLEEDTRPVGAVADRVPDGSFQLSSVITDAGPTRIESTYLCVGILLLPEGTLTKQVLWSPSIFAGGKVGFRMAGAITGGTGAYAGARGEWQLIGLSQNAAKLVYRYRTSSDDCSG